MIEPALPERNNMPVSEDPVIAFPSDTDVSSINTATVKLYQYLGTESNFNADIKRFQPSSV